MHEREGRVWLMYNIPHFPFVTDIENTDRSTSAVVAISVVVLLLTFITSTMGVIIVVLRKKKQRKIVCDVILYCVASQVTIFSSLRVTLEGVVLLALLH